MLDSPPLDVAMRRLAAALDALEDAVDRRVAHERHQNGLDAQVQALGVDRARLAAALDQSRHRGERLETANREVATRLAAAMDTIRQVLDGHGRS